MCCTTVISIRQCQIRLRTFRESSITDFSLDSELLRSVAIGLTDSVCTLGTQMTLDQD